MKGYHIIDKADLNNMERHNIIEMTDHYLIGRAEYHIKKRPHYHITKRAEYYIAPIYTHLPPHWTRPANENLTSHCSFPWYNCK